MRYSLTSLVFAVLAGLCFPFTVRAQAQKLIPVTIKKINNEDGLTLGSGVSLDRIAPTYATPFFEVTRNAQPVNPSAKIRMHVVTSSKALDEVTKANVEIKARYLFTSGKAKTEVEKSTSISEDSFKLVIIGDAEYGDDLLVAPRLRPEAEALIRQNKMKEFAERYGTHYVAREHRVARIVLIVGVDRWSENTRNSLNIALQGKASVPVGGGELNASLQNDLRSAGGRSAITVEASTIGGKALEGFAKLAPAILAAGGDFQQAIGGALEALLAGFQRNNSGIGAVTVQPYEGFTPGDLNLWDELFERKLTDCADRFYAGRQMQLRLKALERDAGAPLKGKLHALVAAYEEYFTDLATFQEALLVEKNREFLKKDLPKEPEIDSEAAKLLVAKYSTLADRVAQLEADHVDITVFTTLLAAGPTFDKPGQPWGKDYFPLDQSKDHLLPVKDPDDPKGLRRYGDEVVGAFMFPYGNYHEPANPSTFVNMTVERHPTEKNAIQFRGVGRVDGALHYRVVVLSRKSKRDNR